MINLKIVLAIIIIHFIGDFVLQTDKQAKGKSKNWSDLLSHTFNYSMVFGLFMCFILPVSKETVYLPTIFFLITFVVHTITDYFTSRLNSYLWNKSDVHNFFISVGADQASHIIQLLLTYYILTK